jgi:hypothetical protein
MTSSSVRLNAGTTDARAKTHRHPAPEASRNGIRPDRLVREETTQAAQAVLRATESEFELLGPEIITVQRVLAGDL